jgi:hypothetical protein
MTPQFNSPELNQLLQLELAEGRYNSSEDALLAGLRILRENRAFRHELADRLTALSDGRAIELKDETELGQFFDEIDAEVDVEMRSERGADA